MLHQDREQPHQLVQLSCQLFKSLGLTVNQKKSLLTPTQSLVFLGFNINSQSMEMSLPQEKLRKIQQDAKRLLSQSTLSIWQVAQFVGKATATMRALPTAPLHYRALQRLMNSVAPSRESLPTPERFDAVVQLDPTSRADLNWWTTLDKRTISAPLNVPMPSQSIDSDASMKGWGAILNNQTCTGGLWSPQEASHHINYLELLAAFLAMKAFGKTWLSITVLLRLDNVTVVAYINQKGGTTSSELCQLAISMWMWCLEKNIILVAEHLPGHLNVIADQESRSMRDRCDWMLNPKVFQTIQAAMGPLEVDLFATRLTNQLPRFYSWRADPEAVATNAFLQDWSQFRGFANPPWCLIHRYLTKVKVQVARMILITPFWNTQSWFPSAIGDVGGLPQPSRIWL